MVKPTESETAGAVPIVLGAAVLGAGRVNPQPCHYIGQQTDEQ